MKFTPNDKAVIFNSGSSALDGVEVTVVGIAQEFPEMAIYIIKLPDHAKYSWDWQCMVLTEHCLQPV